MREYSVRFLIAMIIGICVLLLFMTGKSDQTAIAENLLHRSYRRRVKRMNVHTCRER